MGGLEVELESLWSQLDQLTYYEVLGLQRHCDYVAVRDAFYFRAQRFHPDRFIRQRDPAVRKAVYSVYKRICEAYNVLSDPILRSAYDKARETGAHRLSDVMRSRRLSADERELSNVFARLYMRSARRKLEQGQIVAAWIDTRLGLSMEDAAPLRVLLTQLEAEPVLEYSGNRG